MTPFTLCKNPRRKQCYSTHRTVALLQQAQLQGSKLLDLYLKAGGHFSQE